MYATFQECLLGYSFFLVLIHMPPLFSLHETSVVAFPHHCCVKWNSQKQSLALDPLSLTCLIALNQQLRHCHWNMMPNARMMTHSVQFGRGNCSLHPCCHAAQVLGNSERGSACTPSAFKVDPRFTLQRRRQAEPVEMISLYFLMLNCQLIKGDRQGRQ